MKAYVLTMGPQGYEMVIGVFSTLAAAKEHAESVDEVSSHKRPDGPIMWEDADGHSVDANEWSFIMEFEVDAPHRELSRL